MTRAGRDVAPYEKILVTGAAGLIGSATARELLDRGCRVVASDNFSNGTWRADEPGLEWVEADVGDPDFPTRVADHGVDAVVHSAGHPGGRSLQEPSENVRVNALGSMRVFEWCARSGIPVLYLSSTAVYGEQPRAPIPETAPLRPGTVYAACKIACEEFLRILEAGYDLQWTALRPFAVYGPGHRPSVTQGIANIMLTQLLEGDEVVVKGSLDRVRDLIYIDDAARAIVDCLFNPSARSRVLNVGTGVGTSVGELVVELCAALDRSAKDLTITESEGTVGDPSYSVADIRQLTELGWTPEVDVQAGVRRLVESRRRALAPG